MVALDELNTLISPSLERDLTTDAEVSALKHALMFTNTTRNSSGQRELSMKNLNLIAGRSNDASSHETLRLLQQSASDRDSDEYGNHFSTIEKTIANDISSAKRCRELLSRLQAFAPQLSEMLATNSDVTVTPRAAGEGLELVARPRCPSASDRKRAGNNRFARSY